MLEWVGVVLLIVTFVGVFSASVWYDEKMARLHSEQRRAACPVCSGAGTVLLEVGPPTYGWCTTHFSRWYHIKRLETQEDIEQARYDESS